MPDELIQKLISYYSSQGNNKTLSIWPEVSANQIILIRHGQPDLPTVNWSNRKGALAYASEYDKVGVLPMQAAVLNLNGVLLEHVYASTTPRALHTAQLLFDEGITIIADRRFREFERKIFRFPLGNLSLPSQFWFTTSRILWLLGFNAKGIETRAKAYVRAKENAELLAADAEKHRIAVLVGHGFHNKVVIDRLKGLGWKIVNNGGTKYWSVNILAKTA